MFGAYLTRSRGFADIGRPFTLTPMVALLPQNNEELQSVSANRDPGDGENRGLFLGKLEGCAHFNLIPGSPRVSSLASLALRFSSGSRL
jgi:hypothetical protein